MTIRFVDFDPDSDPDFDVKSSAEGDSVESAAFREAVGHARAIKDAANHSMISGYWAEKRVPLERKAMTKAIAERMNLGSRMGYRDVDLVFIAVAVDMVLEEE